jgi:DNA gyrase subunit A
MTKNNRATKSTVDFTSPAKEIIESPLPGQVSNNFLLYASYVIGFRALPDARDGLKPVHRRILYTARDMGLVPTHAYMKCGRVVGEVMGKLHPHGDSAIYESLVRMSQDFSLSLPLIDGHGNFGSLDSGPAASRYTECRLATAALGLVEGVHEGTVDMVSNYDGSLQEPSVLPSSFPNLLVNGSSGIAVGMATNMAPHNLGEAVAAARLLLAKPKSTLDDLMAVLPGPDFPGGCEVVVGTGAREAYETGKGTVTMRAVARIEPLEGSRGRTEIVVSALPYMTGGTERVIESIKKQILDKKISFVSDIIDLSEGDTMALHVELKSGVNAEQALASLFALTPMQSTFAINSLAIVGGRPKVLTLVEMLQVWIDFRKETVLRRSEHRRGKAQARLHLVDGLLKILDGLDEAIRIIRRSKDTAEANKGLTKSFALSDEQATYILETPLRRLTSLEVDALRKEKKELEATIKNLTDIIENPKRLVKVVDTELADYVAANPSPRRSILLGSVPVVAGVAAGVVASNVAGAASGVAVDDAEYTWTLTAEGLLVSTVDPKKDVVASTATVKGHLMLFCADGVAVKVPASLTDRMKASTAASHNSPVVGIAGIDDTVIMGTKLGVVKALKGGDFPQRGDEHTYIKLEKGDEVLWVGTYVDDAHAVFITDQASLLKFPATAVRPQGRSGGGMAGIKLADGAHVLAFTATTDATNVFTWTDGGAAKTTPLVEYPAKGRGTSGVRCHSFRKGHTALTHAHVGAGKPANDKGKPVTAPTVGKRDGAGL